MLDTFVECSSLKSFTRGIEVDKVRYFFWKLYAIIKEKASTQDFSPSSNFDPVSRLFMYSWSVAFCIA